MKLIWILVSSLTLSLGSYAMDNEFQSEELYSIDHEMLLGCVSSKAECKAMAHHEGFAYLRAVKDAARCPQRPKILACIVQH